MSGLLAGAGDEDQPLAAQIAKPSCWLQQCPARADLDPGWPWLAAQHSQPAVHPSPCDAVLAWSVAAVAAEQVLNLVRRLAENGLGVVLITHNMNDVFQVADSIACLYLGQMAAQVRAKEVNNTQVIELITAGRSGDMGLAPAQADAGAVV